jgi:hypothetical protein
MRQLVEARSAILLVVAGALLASAPVLAQEKMYIDENGVGINTSTPETDLSIFSTVNNGNLMVARSTDGQLLFRIFETSNTGSTLSAYNEAGGEDFRLSGVGSSWFSSAGNVAIGCKSNITSKFVIGSSRASCATAPFSSINPGDSTFTTSSSRTLKENLQSVDGSGILDRLASIDVYQYDFIDGPKDKLGLMAEDFHKVFGRGSDQTINGQEVDMALWLAVKELIVQNRELNAEIEKLKNH